MDVAKQHPQASKVTEPQAVKPHALKAAREIPGSEVSGKALTNKETRPSAVDVLVYKNAELERKLKSIEAENAQLKKELGVIKSENNTLRELVSRFVSNFFRLFNRHSSSVGFFKPEPGQSESGKLVKSAENALEQLEGIKKP